MVLACAGLLGPISGVADEVPGAVAAGFDAYESKGGANAAIATWLADGPLARAVDTQSLVDKLRRIERICGTFRGYRTIHVAAITESTRLAFLEVDYRRCPVFSRFVAYKGSAGWVVTELTLNTKPEKVLPEFLLIGKHAPRGSLKNK